MHLIKTSGSKPVTDWALPLLTYVTLIVLTSVGHSHTISTRTCIAGTEDTESAHHSIKHTLSTQ